MLISAPIYESMLEAGVHVVDSSDGTVHLVLASSEPASPIAVQVKVWTRAVGPAVVAGLESRRHQPVPLLLIAPTFSPEARAAIEERTWSWIAAPANGPVSGHLLAGQHHSIRLGPRSEPLRQPALARGRTPWQRYAIIRHLLLGESWTQADLVAVCRVTQPRVSQVLKELQADGFVTRHRPSGTNKAARWEVTNMARLVDRWLTTYPGPGGAAPTYWFGLDNITDQAVAVQTHLERTRAESATSATPVVSGDAAADFIAPYRRSQLAVVYAPSGADLSSLGLTPALRNDATLKLVAPLDASVWPHPIDDRSRQLAPGAPFELADPLQVAWDLKESGRPDSDQASAAVTRALLSLKAGHRWP